MGRAGECPPRFWMNAERAKEALHRLLKMFESDDLPEAITRTLIRPKDGVTRPCGKCRITNHKMPI
jgi:hypothetical protein